MQIYKTVNRVNGKIYIGKNKTNNPKYLGSGIVLSQSIKKYGRDSFYKEIIEECDTFDILNERETYWIKFYNSTDPSIGYNRTYGGDGFSGITEETIQLISSKNKGKKRSQSTKDNISASLKDKPKTSDHKKALSKAWETRKVEHPYTDKTLEKMRASMLGKNAKNSYELTDPNGITHMTNNLSKFVRENNLHGAQFYKVMAGERESTMGWKCKKLNKDE